MKESDWDAIAIHLLAQQKVDDSSGLGSVLASQQDPLPQLSLQIYIHGATLQALWHVQSAHASKSQGLCLHGCSYDN